MTEEQKVRAVEHKIRFIAETRKALQEHIAEEWKEFTTRSLSVHTNWIHSRNLSANEFEKVVAEEYAEFGKRCDPEHWRIFLGWKDSGCDPQWSYEEWRRSHPRLPAPEIWQFRAAALAQALTPQRWGLSLRPRPLRKRYALTEWQVRTKIERFNVYQVEESLDGRFVNADASTALETLLRAGIKPSRWIMCRLHYKTGEELQNFISGIIARGVGQVQP